MEKADMMYERGIDDVIKMANAHNYDKDKVTDDMLKKNVITHGAKSHAATKGREDVSKKNYRTRTAAFFVIVGIIIAGLGINKGMEHFNRERELDAANDYMSTKIVSYLEHADIDYSLLKDKQIIFLTDDSEKMDLLLNEIMKDGFSKHEAYYLVSETCGKDAFDKIVTTSGYDNGKEFLEANYFKGQTSSDGNLFYTKEADENKFENNIQVEYVERVKKIQDNEQKKLDESRGLKF